MDVKAGETYWDDGSSFVSGRERVGSSIRSERDMEEHMGYFSDKDFVWGT